MTSDIYGPPGHSTFSFSDQRYKTLYDLQSFILDAGDAHGGYADVTSRRRAYRAAMAAYQTVTNSHRWRMHRRAETHRLNAAVTQDISIDATGTATSGTDFPSWISGGSILAPVQGVRDSPLPVIEVVDNTTVKVRGWNGGSYSGTATLGDNRIELQYEPREILYLFDDQREELPVIHFDGVEQLRAQILTEPSGLSRAVARVPRYGPEGFAELIVLPAPSTSTVFRVFYEREPIQAELVHEDTVSVSGTTATLSTGIDSTANLFGSVLIVSTDDKPPASRLSYGPVQAEQSPISAVIPIESVTSSTAIELHSGTDLTRLGDVSDRGCVITHIIDLPEHCWNALTIYGDAHFKRIGNGATGEFWQVVNMADQEIDRSRARDAELMPPTEMDNSLDGYWLGEVTVR